MRKLSSRNILNFIILLDIHYLIKIIQIIIRNKSKELLKLIAHPVDLLDVGEDHLGVYPPLLHHP